MTLTRHFFVLYRPGNPWPELARIRAEEPVYRDPTGMWGLFRHEDIVWAERHPDLFSNAQGSRPRGSPQPSMIDSDDPHHARRRRLVYKGFTPKRVADHEPELRKIVTDLIDAVATRGECDFVADIAAPLPMIVIAEMPGVAATSRRCLRKLASSMANSLSKGSSTAGMTPWGM